jgi:hypothetical protein
MVTKREEIDYYGLRISIIPVEEKPFYLTGDTPLFSVMIRNPTPTKCKGKILVSWRLGELRTFRVIAFELEPYATGQYQLPREWLYREGTAIYELEVLPGPPEDYAGISDNDVIFQVTGQLGIHNVHPLCSYYVRDKDLHRYEEDYRKTIKRFSLITIGLTIFNVILTVVRAFFSY